MTRRLSIVTVCMNRREHLLHSAQQVAAWPHHQEHLIVDWSSAIPIDRRDLPADSRLRLLRVEGERGWNLARAYNFACAQAQGDCLFKLDADCWPEPQLHPLQWLHAGPVCQMGSGPDGRLGQWVLDRDLFERVGGFNELMQGYGFDDKDLKARLIAHGQVQPQPLPLEALGVLRHSVLLRAEPGKAVAGVGAVQRAQALKRTSSLANRLVAAACPWSASRPRSRYRQDAATGHWQLEPGSAPQLPDAVRREWLRLRRDTFWSELLWVPAPLVRQLPPRLLPVATGEGFAIRPWLWLLWGWQRLSWAPLLCLLACFRNTASGLRRSWQGVRRSLRQGLAVGCRWLLDAPLVWLLPARLQELGLKARVDAALRLGQPVELIWADLQQLLRQHGSEAVLHRLLFRRGYRPRRPADQVALFEAMAADVAVPEVLRAYARISLAYRSLKDTNRPLAQALIPALNAQVQALLSDPDSLRCQRSNRRNRFKLLVSSLTALMHLQLLVGEQSGLQASADQLLALLEPHPWLGLPADVAFRLLTNTCRCLGMAALLAWRLQNRDRLQAILLLLDALQREAWADRHRHSAAQENHRAYVAQMRWRVAALLEPVAERGVLQQENPGLAVGLWALNVTTPALERRLEALLS
ncbi:glycosyltransferase family 2 protein [Vulcanococcus sp.]|jgi:hypothetical protein|uniref:glycosyltransferase family 2 protein n=1 Tax=Vulcanococcus sp. TaxID=2856995 RepID=UPI0037D9BB00